MSVYVSRFCRKEFSPASFITSGRREEGMEESGCCSARGRGGNREVIDEMQ
jgi:hypothetical protein